MCQTNRAEEPSDEFSEEEIARRRDEVVRRMANTPPQPRTKSPSRRTGKKKPTGRGQADGKPKAGEEA